MPEKEKPMYEVDIHPELRGSDYAEAEIRSLNGRNDTYGNVNRRGEILPDARLTKAGKLVGGAAIHATSV